MKEIPLTRGQVALVDDDDYDYLVQYNWYVTKRGNTFYAIRSLPRVDGKQTHIAIHREILNPPDSMQIDHINRDGLDNRKENLRLATNSQNHINIPKRRGSSRYKGVYWNKEHNKWAAKVTINNKTLFLGYFDTESIAAGVYNQFASSNFGEFALLNIITPDVPIS